MDSILTSVKKALGIDANYNHFDPDLIMHINSVFTILLQLGIGPEEGFSISDDNSNWTDFISDMSKLQFVKTYMYLKVRLLFDPPSSGTHVETINREISELEWRLSVSK